METRTHCKTSRSMKIANQGFTLIEVIVAMVIMTFLSIFTVQSIQRALATKAKVQKDIDKNSTVRDALRIMERDVNMAFNYRDVYAELYNKAQDARQKGVGTATTSSQTPGVPTPPANPAAAVDPDKYKKKTPKVYTHFIGEAQAMDFTSLSNVRMMEESQISQQAEIGYHLKPCRRRSNQEQSSNCLWRRISNYIHEDITKEGQGQETVLLENVTEFKLRYLGPGKDEEWVDAWATNERGDDVTRNKFPFAVEITIEVKDSKDKPLRLTTVAAIRNPNNPPDSNDPNNPNKDPQNAAGNSSTTTTTTTTSPKTP